MADLAKLTMTVSGLYHWARFVWNLGCYACHVPSLTGIHMTCRMAIMWNMTSSIKPEAHNVSERRQRRIEPGLKATRNKFGEVWLGGFRVMRADRQTSRQADITILRAPPRAKS